MSKLSTLTALIVARVVAFVAYCRNRRAVVRAATLLTAVSVPVLVGGTAHADATPADPLGGAGQDLVNDLLANFQTYVIPVVGALIIAVVAFKLIVKLGTRFMNRA